ncbi:MAG TPA: primosomal protein N' [Terracidiphilus sp.]|nr:primosomal protein N' [Terracidiphilus sp.]
MHRYCEVALPVPVDRTFTYAVPAGPAPVRGGRVIAPFRGQKLIGVVTQPVSAPPEDFEAKAIQAVLDEEPLLSGHLMELAEWIAQYYLAPLGEVLRGMTPLMAEVRRTVYYRITDLGRDVLANSLEEGVSHLATRAGRQRPRVAREEENLPFRVLKHLAAGERVSVSRLRTATSVPLPILAAMLRKRWIAREESAVEREVGKMQRFVVLVPEIRLPALTPRQQEVLAELAARGGEMPLSEVRRKDMSSSSVQTLVRRGMVRIEERPESFRMGGLEAPVQPLRLNRQQEAALAAITGALGRFQPFLLQGVTGSGKTAVYLAAMKQALERNLGSILLVPEIGLTPQMAGLLQAVFGERFALLHSSLTPDERAEQWRRIHRGETPIVVGTRSAVFAPVPNLGLILVDEEHDQSYKQEETPRYHARDVAVMRAKLAGAAVVLGSATPSLESWQNAATGRYALLRLQERIANRPLPQVELVDMRSEFRETGTEQIFSRVLIAEAQAALERGEQVLILLNRRGFSFVVICRACGEKLECENCAIALTHHKADADRDGLARAGQRLECHYCGFRRPVPARCPKCESEHLYYLGVGSQQAEERLSEIFPGARIGRMDRDAVRGRHELEGLLTRLHSGEINLLVGTQMIAKGHDIHGVTLVGVVGCDHALAMPDFRAAERVFQIITQVAGRAGRGELPGRVIVQTYYPDHYAVVAASNHDFQAFAARELKFRQWMHYPPLGVLANVLVHSPGREEAQAWAEALGKWYADHATGGVRVLGPCAAPIARIKNVYRFHLVLKAASRKVLNGALRGMLAHADAQGIPRKNLVVDVDAQRLM